MEEKVLTLADIGVTALHIGYNEDRSKAVIEINRVDNDRETLSKLETLKDNFKFRPTGQKSLYEIESIETFERFYRLFCIKVEERDKPVKEDMPKYVINIKTVFGSFSDTCSFDGLIYECKLNANTEAALSLLYENKDSVLLVVSGYAPVYRAVRADLDSEEKKIKVYMSIYACYNNVRKDVTWLHSLEDLKAIGDGSKVPWNAGMLTYKLEDAMPKGEGKPTVVVDLFDELSVQGMFTKDDDDDAIRYIHIVRDEKLATFYEKYREFTPILRVRMACGLVYYILNERTNGINCEVWAVMEISIPSLISFNEPKLVGKLCSSKDSAPTTRRINSVKLNKVTRL